MKAIKTAKQKSWTQPGGLGAITSDLLEFVPGI